ncbi:hypothetical protein IWQ60_010475 [Tieghemiomyces parasiticus]|uniref:TATA element modulatory factor 1 TATA binding domain-containing protein n=1 Tax=Tieghemiomyces parasiticus TaxID=78921 RepID=A0A9W7ZLI0_9FUNG|nr:hypothetical protein IWQ60_010475 [Tieghemiomyces parasiticus]
MSFFGAPDANRSWGGIFKQAINSVENRLDQVLDIAAAGDGQPGPVSGPASTPGRSSNTMRRTPSQNRRPPGAAQPPRQPRASSATGAQTPQSRVQNSAKPVPTASESDLPALVPLPADVVVAASAMPPSQRLGSNQNRTDSLRAKHTATTAGTGRDGGADTRPGRQSLDERLNAAVNSSNATPATANITPTMSTEQPPAVDRLPSPALSIVKPTVLEDSGALAVDRPSPATGERVSRTYSSPRLQQALVDPLVSPEPAASRPVRGSEDSMANPPTSTSSSPPNHPTVLTTPGVAAPTDTHELSASAESDTEVERSSAPTMTTVTPLDPRASLDIDEAVLQRTLEQRERQLEVAQEQNGQLTSQIDQLKAQLDHRQALTTAAAAEHESTLALRNDEISLLKTGIEALLANSKGNSDIQKLEKVLARQKETLTERDAQLSQLIEEGGNLSRKELRLSNTIKRLRGEVADGERLLRAAQAKTEKVQAKVDEGERKLRAQKEADVRRIEQLKAQATQVDQLKRTVQELQNGARAAEKAQAKVQASLEAANKEIQASKAKVAQAQREASSQAREQETARAQALENKLRHTEAALAQQGQVADAKLEERDQEIATLNANLHSQETTLLGQISTLRMRLELAESSSETYNVSIHEHTAPLFRQIEELTNRLNTETVSRATTERKLQTNLKKALKQLADRDARISALEQRVADLTEQVESAEASLADARVRSEDLEDERGELTRQAEEAQVRATELESQVERMTKQLTRATQVNLDLERQLTAQQAEAGLPRAAALSPSNGPVAIHSTNAPETSAIAATTNGLEVNPPPPSSSSSASLPASPHHSLLLRGLSPRLEASRPSSPASSRRGSVSTLGGTPTPTTGPDASVTGSLTAMRQLKAQIATLQTQLQTVSDRRTQLEETLATKAAETEELVATVQRLTTLETESKDLAVRHATVLELLGEKTELVAELQADISDMKEMYKVQITELITRVEQLTKR